MKRTIHALAVSFPLAVLAGACASMSGGSYRASSLRVFVPSNAARLEQDGVMLLVGRLRNESDVARVLGRRSARLARDAVVLQLSLRSPDRPVRLSPDSLKLVLGSGDELNPLTPGQVLAAVSLPEDYWQAPYRENPLRDPTRLQLPGEPATQTVEGPSALFMLGMVGLDAAILKAGATEYRDQARPDVEDKTSLPREASPGQTLDLLVVFLPPPDTVPREGQLRLRTEIEVSGKRLDAVLVVD